MERGQSRAATAPGGVGRSGGSGWWSVRRLVLLGACGVAAAGTGCVTANKATRGVREALGLAVRQPATTLTTAFQPQIQHLPDPTQDGSTLRPGIVGQVYLIAADGQYADVDGDLIVMADDVTPRPPGMPTALSEVWHFDKLTLRKLRSSDERFGQHYALFLPYPSNWKDVSQIRVSTRYEPKPDSGTPAGPKLTGPAQVIVLDFTPPGAPVWTKVDGRPTAPVELKGIPDLNKAIAQGKTGAPLVGSQPGGTATAGNVPPPTTPQLPPPQDMNRNPYVVMPGPNGSTVHTAAIALPPGQTVPPGWTLGPDKKLVPLPGTNPWAVATQPNATQPNATQPPPAMQPPAMQPPAYQPPAYQPSAYQPPAMQPPAQPGPLPLPIPPQQPAGFDPNSPVGPWANGGSAPSAPGFPPVSLPPVDPTAGGGTTAVIPRR